MNLKRWALATVAAFAAIFATDSLIHHVWLGDFYRANAQWWRPEAQMKSLSPLMFLSQLSLAALLTVVYAKGYERSKGGLVQGFRFGVLMGLLLLLPHSLMTYCVYPYPMSLILTWFGGGLIELALAGTVIGTFYQPR